MSYSLARSKTLFRKMKLVPTDEIGLYDFAVGLWNCAGQTRVGVTRCTNIEKMLALYAPPSRKTGKVPAHSAPSKRKPDHERDPSSCVVQVPHTMQTHAFYVPSLPASPASCSSTPFPSPSALFQERAHNSFLSAITSVDVDTDDRWAHGQVFVLSGFGTWPAGVYTQDMVRVFGRISSGRASDSEVESRFESAFPGIPYVKAPYARQLQFYRKLS
ncbi:hypothetical protein B0H13DRAFT_2340250 [Mycena leptocephala]|nr:hypothetical protein B0H13DRAFT_2340250 [Mycena leptocephala]